MTGRIFCDEIEPISETCGEGKHEQCGRAGNRSNHRTKLDDCYCECHKPQDEQSVYFRLTELSRSTLPDSQRLQVLIQLVTKLAGDSR